MSNPAEYNVEIFFIRADLPLPGDVKRFVPHDKQVIRVESELYKESKFNYMRPDGTRIKKDGLLKLVERESHVIQGYAIYCFKDDIDNACNILMEKHKKDLAHIQAYAKQLSETLSGGFEVMDSSAFIDHIGNRKRISEKE